MKIYQIAGKQYAVSGDDIYEQVPEFSPLAATVDDTVQDVEVSRVTRTTWPVLKKKKKQVHNRVSKKTYQRGTCGRCGKEGHSAWHCPDRPETKGAAQQKKKDARAKKVMDRVFGLCFCGRPSSHRGIHRGSKVSSSRKKIEKRVYQPPQEVEVIANDDRSDEDLGVEVHRLQQEGLDSLQIASKLRLRISKVNQLWDPDIAQGKAEEEEGSELI